MFALSSSSSFISRPTEHDFPLAQEPLLMKGKPINPLAVREIVTVLGTKDFSTKIKQKILQNFLDFYQNTDLDAREHDYPNKIFDAIRQNGGSIYMPGAKLKGRATGFNLSHILIAPGSSLSMMHLIDTDLTGANLIGATIERSVLLRTILVDADLTNATMTDWTSMISVNMEKAKTIGFKPMGVFFCLIQVSEMLTDHAGLATRCEMGAISTKTGTTVMPVLGYESSFYSSLTNIKRLKKAVTFPTYPPPRFSMIHTHTNLPKVLVKLIEDYADDFHLLAGEILDFVAINDDPPEKTTPTLSRAGDLRNPKIKEAIKAGLKRLDLPPDVRGKILSNSRYLRQGMKSKCLTDTLSVSACQRCLEDIFHEIRKEGNTIHLEDTDFSEWTLLDWNLSNIIFTRSRFTQVYFFTTKLAEADMVGVIFKSVCFYENDVTGMIIDDPDLIKFCVVRRNENGEMRVILAPKTMTGGGLEFSTKETPGEARRIVLSPDNEIFNVPKTETQPATQSALGKRKPLSDSSSTSKRAR